jgi:hypothetical protein
MILNNLERKQISVTLQELNTPFYLTKQITLSNHHPYKRLGWGLKKLETSDKNIQ